MSTRAAPTKAFILAAGFGTRMRPLSFDTPKSVMPLWGRPLIHHTLDRLQSWGVRDVVVNLHHDPDAVVRCVLGWSAESMRVAFSFESEIRGTGGALVQAAWFFDTKPFWIVNADIVADVPPEPLLRALSADARSLAALWMDPSSGPRTVRVSDGLVRDFADAQPGSPGTFTFCGLHLVSPRLIDYLPAGPFSSVIDGYRAAMAAGWTVRAISVPGAAWADVGTPAQYLAAHELTLQRQIAGLAFHDVVDPGAQARVVRCLRRRAVHVTGFVALGQGVRVEPGAVLANSVLWSGAHVGHNATVTNAIVGTDATVRSAVHTLAVKSVHIHDPPFGAALKRLGWKATDTTAIPLDARGSDRTFTRLESDRQRVMLIRYGDIRPENAMYARHARFLARAGLAVPHVLLDMPREKLLVMQDLGDDSLLQVCGQSPHRTRTLYRRTIELMVALHTRGTAALKRDSVPLSEPFAAPLYRWEREYFAEHFLLGYMALPTAAVTPILRDLARLALVLQSTQNVLLHRDFQSSNVFLVRGRPYLIDFQGMRLGPATYDLASLLCDPYMSLGASLQDDLLAFYRTCAGEHSARLFWEAAVERLAQALGAYARLGAQPATRSFAGHIPAALRMMQHATEHIDGVPHLRRFLRSEVVVATTHARATKVLIPPL